MKLTRIQLPSMPNLRQMTQYKNVDGKSIKTGKLFRSENLLHASTDDKKKLFSPSGLNIKTILDLRNQRERELFPYSLPSSDVNYVNIDVSDYAFLQNIHFTHGIDSFFDAHSFDKLKEIIKDMYGEFVRNAYCREQLKRVFELILSSGGDAILFHCVSGKDRTGLLTAIIMMMLDFSPKDVKKEYLLTNIRRLDYNLRKFDNIRKQNKTTDYMRKYQYLTLVNPNNLQAFLQEIGKHFDSPQAYFDSLGMDKTNIAKLKQLLLEE